MSECLLIFRSAFDARDEAKELRNIKNEDGSFSSLEIFIGNSVIMVFPAKEGRLPNSMSLYLYAEDTDAIYKKAISAGAMSLMEPVDMFYGDR